LANEYSQFKPDFGVSLQRLREKLHAQGVETTIESGTRTYQDQQELAANAKATHQGLPLPYPQRGYVPMAAAPGSSPHEFGYAADLKAVNPADQSKVWAAASDFGLRAIGPGDPNHVELQNWQMYNRGAAAPGAPGSQAAPARPVTMTRGMRNNNPGNLVPSSWVQNLPGYKGSDGKFAIFDTMEHGQAALDANLKSYGGKGINTPFGVASTWAPASEKGNNPSSYGAQIAKTLGVGLNDKIDLNDPAVRAKIAQAITAVENGPGATGITKTAPTTPGTTITAMGKVPGAVAAAQPFVDQAQQVQQAAAGDQNKPPEGPNLLDMRPGLRGVGPYAGPAAGMGLTQGQAAQMQANPVPALGTTLSSIQNPLAWSSQPLGATPPGQQPYGQFGPQSQQGGPMGTTLSGLTEAAAQQAMQQNALYQLYQQQQMTNPSGGAYG
jgi:hypothetical protein